MRASPSLAISAHSIGGRNLPVKRYTGKMLRGYNTMDHMKIGQTRLFPMLVTFPTATPPTSTSVLITRPSTSPTTPLQLTVSNNTHPLWNPPHPDEERFTSKKRRRRRRAGSGMFGEEEDESRVGAFSRRFGSGGEVLIGEGSEGGAVEEGGAADANQSGLASPDDDEDDALFAEGGDLSLFDSGDSEKRAGPGEGKSKKDKKKRG